MRWNKLLLLLMVVLIIVLTTHFARSLYMTRQDILLLQHPYRYEVGDNITGWTKSNLGYEIAWVDGGIIYDRQFKGGTKVYHCFDPSRSGICIIREKKIMWINKQ